MAALTSSTDVPSAISVRVSPVSGSTSNTACVCVRVGGEGGHVIVYPTPYKTHHVCDDEIYTVLASDWQAALRHYLV